VGLTDDDVREILRLIDESQLDELRIETPELRLHVRRGSAADAPDPAADPAPFAAAPPAAAPQPRDTVSQGGGADALAAGLHAVDSPMLGVFYRAPAPGAEPYVEVGAPVEADTVVCLIEVMKMMNSIVAGVAGTIVEVCVQNAELVEYGQPLFRIEPA
jgi:acetyl-CoA carboxylase biotin carboxyl carrier protein